MSNQQFDIRKFLATANGGRTVLNYRANQTVFFQGDPADSVYFVQKGQVKVTVRSKQGKEAIIAIHGPGDFFGEGCLTDQLRRLATASAMTASSIMRLEKTTMIRVIHDEQTFCEMFMTYILNRNTRVEADLVDQHFNSSERRLARALLLMANFGKEGQHPEMVIPKLKQETLAEIVGTTRSQVSVFMNKFRDLGFIEYNGDIKVYNSLLNVVLHGY